MAKMKVISVVFEESIDISGFTPEADASVSAGTTTVSGKVLMVAEIAKPPTELVSHVHGVSEATTSPPIVS